MITHPHFTLSLQARRWSVTQAHTLPSSHLEIVHLNFLFASPRRDDSGLVTQILDVRAHKPRRQARQPSGKLGRVAAKVEALEVYLEDRLAALNVGPVGPRLWLGAATKRWLGWPRRVHLKTTLLA